MVFQKNTLYIQQEIEKTFNYYLQKDYLIKYFDENEKITIVSQYDNDIISNLETIKIISEDDETIAELVINNIEIVPFEYIKMNMKYGGITDKTEELDEADEENLAVFINKIIGSDIIYTIRFIPSKNNTIKVIEYSEIHHVSFFAKFYWKIFGFFENRKQRKIYLLVKKEIEAL